MVVKSKSSHQDEGELLNRHRDPTVLLEVRPTDAQCNWNGTCTIEKGKKVEVLVNIPHPPSDSSSLTVLSPLTTCTVCISRSAFKSCSHINVYISDIKYYSTDGKDLPIQIPAKYLSF